MVTHGAPRQCRRAPLRGVFMKISFVAAAICAVLALGSTAAHAQTYAYVIDVAKSGSPFNDPVLALASITDASADHPYLVKIHPGVYDVGATAVTGKPY